MRLVRGNAMINVKAKKVYSEILAKKVTEWIAGETSLNEIEYLKIKLGIESILINISKSLIVFFAAMFFQTLILTILAYVAYVAVRKFSQGLHAKSSVMCTIVSILMFVAVPYMVQNVVIDRLWVFLVGVGTTYLLYKYAPADTEKSPIIDYDVRKQLKWRSVGANIFLMFIALVVYNSMVRTMIVTGVVMQIIMVLPITYKILGRGYNNYEEYEAEV